MVLNFSDTAQESTIPIDSLNQFGKQKLKEMEAGSATARPVTAQPESHLAQQLPTRQNSAKQDQRRQQQIITSPQTMFEKPVLA